MLLKKTELGWYVRIIMLFCVLLLTPQVFAEGKKEELATEGNPIELSYATNRPPTDPQSTIWLTPMLNEIEKQTGGKVKFKVYWSSSLGDATDQYSMIRDGMADMTDFATLYVPGKFPLADVANLPFAAQDPRNLMNTMNQLAEEGYFDSMWDEVEWLSFHSTSSYKFLFRNEKPMSVGELKGLKARAPGGVATEWESSIGMVPISVSISDAYTAWQTGLVDVWVHPAGSVIKYKFTELPCRAFLDLGFYTMANAACAFNKEKFTVLPKDIQEIIKNITHEYSYIYLQSDLDIEKKAYELMKNSGIEIYRWSDAEVEKMKSTAVPLWKKYISDLNSKGYDGDKFVNRFIEILENRGEKPPIIN